MKCLEFFVIFFHNNYLYVLILTYIFALLKDSESSQGINLGTHRLHSPSDFQQTAIWWQALLFLGFRWRRRISISDFHLHVLLAVYTPTVYSSTQEWSWS